MNAFKFIRKKQPADKSPAMLKNVAPLNRFIITFLVLLTCLVITYFIWNTANTNREKELQSYFEFRAREINTHIVQRINSYEQVLRSTRGFYVASDYINRKEFSSYFNSLNLNKNYPGIQGVGFSLIIPPAHLKEHINEIRKEGFPEYKIWPEGKRETYTSIIYLEPFRDLNLRAFGYDMFSEPVRRKAMEMARDSNETKVSGKIILVQEAVKAVQAGFLIYLPVYKNGAPLSNVSERRANIIGWVYSPFRMNDFMKGSFGEHAADIDIEIYDTKNISIETKMYDSNTYTNIKVKQLVLRKGINFRGHEWTVLIKSTPQLESRIGINTSRIILIVGLSISFLLTIITWLIGNKRKQTSIVNAEREHVLTSLKENEQKFMTLAEQSPNLIFINYQEKIVYVNKKGADALGYSKKEFYSDDFDFFKLIADGYKELTIQNISKQFQGIELGPQDYTLITKNGKRLEVIFSVELIDYEGGKAIMGTIMDITERKRAEEELSKSERRTRALLDANPDMIFRMNREGTYLDYKANRSDLYAQSEQTIIGKKNKDITPPEFANLVDRYIRQTLDSGEMQEFEYQMITPKRGLRDYEARMVASGKDEVIAVVRDITERKKLETNLSTAAELAKLGYWEFDVKSGNFTFDDQYYRLIHGSSTEIQGGNIMSAEEFVRRLVHPDDSKTIGYKLTGSNHLN